MRALSRLTCLLCAALSLAACAPMLSLIGTNQTLVQVTAQVERVKLAGDGASYATSHKTITDHALSIATGKDCRLFNVFDKESVCADMPRAVAANSDNPPKVAAAAASPAEPQTQAAVATEAVATETEESPAQPQTQATAKPSAPEFEYSHDQASGD